MFFPFFIPIIGGAGIPKDEMDRLEIYLASTFLISVVSGLSIGAYGFFRAGVCDDWYYDPRPGYCNWPDVALMAFGGAVGTMATLMLLTGIFLAVRRLYRALTARG